MVFASLSEPILARFLTECADSESFPADSESFPADSESFLFPRVLFEGSCFPGRLLGNPWAIFGGKSSGSLRQLSGNSQRMWGLWVP